MSTADTDADTEPSGEPQTPPEGGTTPESTGGTGEPGDAADTGDGGDGVDPQVRRLRDENAKYRTRARDAEARVEALADRLLDETVRSALDGVLADPADLRLHYDASDLTDDQGEPDADAIRAAGRELVDQRPYLAPRRPSGDVDQGARDAGETVDLAGMLRRGAS